MVVTVLVTVLESVEVSVLLSVLVALVVVVPDVVPDVVPVLDGVLDVVTEVVTVVDGVEVWQMSMVPSCIPTTARFSVPTTPLSQLAASATPGTSKAPFRRHPRCVPLSSY